MAAPFRRKEPVFEAQAADGPFQACTGNNAMSADMTSVKVVDIVNGNRPPIFKYDPGHPDANAKGYVAMPNIQVVEEMVNMMSASRSYEANVSAIKTIKDMIYKAMEIGR